MSPSYSLLPGNMENNPARRVSNISSLYLEKTSFNQASSDIQSKSQTFELQEHGENKPVRFDEDIPIRFIKLAVIGDSGVGKSSILERFVRNTFSGEHSKTEKKVEYCPSLLLDNSIFELKVVDIPVIPYFPRTPEEEWEHFRFYGLRSAHAYLLVFDITSQDSFNYISNIREQIENSRDTSNIPLIVIANKSDLVQNLTPQQIRNRAEIIQLVKKSWRVNYLESSAKYNYKITSIFKLLAQELKSAEEKKKEGRHSQSQRTNCFKCLP